MRLQISNILFLETNFMIMSKHLGHLNLNFENHVKIDGVIMKKKQKYDPYMMHCLMSAS